MLRGQRVGLRHVTEEDLPWLKRAVGDPQVFGPFTGTRMMTPRAVEQRWKDNGFANEDAERLIIKPLEKELRAIEGVKEMNSTAFLGGANVVMEFDAGFDADQALIDVREKVDLAKPELPEDVIAGYIGDGASMLVRRALGDPEGDVHDEEYLNDALTYFLDYYREHKLDFTYVYPGVVESITSED